MQVGYPNAGKSSLLKAVSSASPKIASYPFTTLFPFVGVVELNDLKERTFTMADLPGLVHGAHMNVGLGHEFLRHIERTKVLLYVIDVARPIKAMKSAASVSVSTPVSAAPPTAPEGQVTDLGDPVAEFLSLRNELRLYSPALEWRPSVVFCNKLDMKPVACQNQIKRLREVVPEHWPIFTGSAKDHKGLEPLLQTLSRFLEHKPANSSLNDVVDIDSL